MRNIEDLPTEECQEMANNGRYLSILTMKKYMLEHSKILNWLG